MHFDGDKKSTRFLEQNIFNLSYAEYEGDGYYDIPKMLPTHVEDLRYIPIQGFNYAIKEKHPEKMGVHFFLHDYQFERVWNYPERYIDVLKRFKFVLSPDFSVYQDTPRAVNIINCYRKMWCGRFWQEHGITVIPTVTWSTSRDYEYCFDGIPKHSTIAVSTMGSGRWGEFNHFDDWELILDKLEPDAVLLYGRDISDQLSGNIIYKSIVNTKVVI